MDFSKRDLIKFLASLNTKKIQVLEYLLDNKDNQNSLNTNQREISLKTKISVSTVNETIKTLKNAGLLSVKGTVYTLSIELLELFGENQ